MKNRHRFRIAPIATLILFLFGNIAAATAEQPGEKYPLALKITSAIRRNTGEATVVHGAPPPPQCKEPKTGFWRGYCAAYNPSDTVVEDSTLILTAILGTTKYALSCPRCRMLEIGEYPAKREGTAFVIVAHKIDKRGNRKGKGQELKLTIVGEESIPQDSPPSNPDTSGNTSGR